MAVVSTTSVAGRCTPGSDLEPPLCPTNFPKIVKVTILENSAGSPGKTDGFTSCNIFHINEAQVRHYFSKAKTVAHQDVHYGLYWGPCYAAGNIEFKDGRKGSWSINQSRSGSISIGDEERIYLYCPECNGRPF
jgi:hypothetical protein